MQTNLILKYKLSKKKGTLISWLFQRSMWNKLFLKKNRYCNTLPNSLVVEKKSLRGQLALLGSVVENFTPDRDSPDSLTTIRHPGGSVSTKDSKTNPSPWDEEEKEEEGEKEKENQSNRPDKEKSS